jgi:hypothetical protein
MALEFSTSHLADSISLFRYYKKLGERAMAQLADSDLLYAPDPECNSIALIVKHLAGNMRSRWTDFLSTDGEKSTRHRDSEFEEPAQTREELIRDWDEGWDCLLKTLESLTDADLTKTIRIRGEKHSVTQAINRQLCHYSYHIGQIVQLAKQRRGREWNCLTVPKNKSADWNRRVKAGEASQR